MSRHREASLLLFLVGLLAALLPAAWSEFQRNREQLAAAQKQRTVSAFLTQVARQGHRIDTRFLRLEEALEGLATAATWALTHGIERDEPVYFHEDFNTPGREPADLTASDLYRVPVSVDWPVAVRAPGLAREAVLPKLRRLSPLRHHLRRMFLESGPAGSLEWSPADQRHLLLEGGGAMDYGYLVLPEGVLYLYPGMGCTPDDYDPRVRPYYTLAAHKRGKHWGNPYVDSSTDATGDDLVLPCATSMYDEKGEFLGVAVVECIFNKLIQNLMLMPHLSAVKETMLADGEGRVIVDSRDLNLRFRNDQLDQGLELKPYGEPAVVEAVRARRSGYVETTLRGESRLIAHFRLETIGWFFIVEADPAGLTSGD